MTRVSPLSLVEGISSRAFPLLGADGAPLLGRDGAPATLTLSLRFAAPDAAAEVQRLKAQVEEARPRPRTPPSPLPPVISGHASSLPPVLTGHVSSHVRTPARPARKRGFRAQAARCE